MAESTPEENTEIVRRFIEEVVNNHRFELIDELFTDDYTRHDDEMMSENQKGPEAFRTALEQLATAFPDGKVELGELFGEGDLVAFEATQTGTHKGEFMGIEPTNREFEMSGTAIHRVRDGKISETWANWNSLSMLQQLGVTPVPEATD